MAPTYINALSSEEQQVQDPRATFASTTDANKKKRFVLFISHFKIEAATDARLIQMELERILHRKCFLDSVSGASISSSFIIAHTPSSRPSSSSIKKKTPFSLLHFRTTLRISVNFRSTSKTLSASSSSRPRTS